ncbi:MAG TPA: hypothetical protein VIV13_03730 [Solirubrobacterales bacterium]
MITLAHEIVIQDGSDLWTKLGTVATLLAVLAALFGPLLLDRMRRPRLEVTVASDLVAALATGPGQAGGRRLTVNITNEGRRQANDVQVFLSVEAPVDVPGLAEVHRIESFQSPIPFLHREGGAWTSQYSVAIPPGFSRPLEILVEDLTGFHLASAEEHDPGKPISETFGLEEGDHRVVLDMVGSNFRVVRLEGQLQIRNEPSNADAKWSEPPRIVRYRAGDPLPS